MKSKETIEQLELKAEKQHVILMLRVAMMTNRSDMVDSIVQQFHNINYKMSKQNEKGNK